ncbi:MAG: MFS transporter [Chloroflexi bacterium]|nr:MFS transporter [Chloroflexota bacterium]MDA1147521.1 MFS transporter [Chloroflexota bacterium]
MSELSRQRRAVAAVFFTHGVLLASWVPHIPFVKEQRALSDGALGLVLLALAGGAVVAMALSGPLIRRVGPHHVVRWTGLAMALTLPLPVIAPNVALLTAALVLFGGALGSLDIAMNAVAADVEVAFRRPIMSSFHGMYSLGALAGSLLAGALIEVGVAPSTQVLVVAVIAMVAVLLVMRALRTPHRPVAQARLRLRIPRGRLLALGAMTFAVFLAEGAVADWSATLLRDDLGTSGAVAALGFAAFSTTMAIGRLTGDWINERVGAVNLVRLGSLVAAIGLGVGLALDSPIAVIIGFALTGAGLANVVPLAFTAAASAGATPSEGISSAATLGYFGLLVGPPIIGFIAEATSLAGGLAVVAALAALTASQARIVRTPLRT